MIRLFEVLRAGIGPLRKKRLDPAAGKDTQSVLHRRRICRHGKREILPSTDENVKATLEIVDANKRRRRINAASELRFLSLTGKPSQRMRDDRIGSGMIF